MRQTYINTPFALSGDKTPIPGPVDLTGAVSYTQGWGPDYERELGVDSLAKPVSRGVNNYLFNVITTAIKAYQEQAWPEWIAPAENGGVPVAYAAGTVVTVPTNPAATRQWVSLVDANNVAPGSDPLKWQPLLYRRATSAELSAGTSTTAIATIADIKAMVESFASVFDGYTKSESDARYTRRANNLSDLANAATARSNLGLGTAATANLTTSSTDTTAGRALKVGDFALGGSPAADTADPDALQFSCFFRAFNSAKMPTLETFSGIHTQGNSGNSDASQIVWNPATNKTYTRTRTSAGSWSAWAELYTTANVGTFMQTLLPAATKEIAQAALGVAITKEFVSGELTITASGLISIPHSLGARPKFITAEAVCKIASVGWSVGDVVGIAVSPFVTDTNLTRGIQVAYDPVNVIAKIAANTLAIMNKTSGAATGVNASDWRLVLRAYV